MFREGGTCGNESDKGNTFTGGGRRRNRTPFTNIKSDSSVSWRGSGVSEEVILDPTLNLSSHAQDGERRKQTTRERQGNYTHADVRPGPSHLDIVRARVKPPTVRPPVSSPPASSRSSRPSSGLRHTRLPPASRSPLGGLRQRRRVRSPLGDSLFGTRRRLPAHPPEIRTLCLPTGDAVFLFGPDPTGSVRRDLPGVTRG